MAKYFLSIKTFSRGRGARVTRAAAYRAGERIRDERTSEVYNFCGREDVAHKEIVLPSQFADSAEIDWARDRSTLWNVAEHTGRRRNAKLGREVLVLLPPELTPSQRTNLVRSFSRKLADKYQSAVDMTIHSPRPGADERHHHAHMLMTTREVTPAGLGRRTTLELSGTERHARRLGPRKIEYFWIREQWALVTNHAFHEAGVAARIDHRSLKDQGINREPTPAMPQKIYYAERKTGRSTHAGDDVRAKHRERVEARLKGSDELARVLRKQSEERRQREIERSRHKEGLPKQIPRGALTREELNQLKREWYRANRERLNRQRREQYRENVEVQRERARQNYRSRRQANVDETLVRQSLKSQAQSVAETTVAPKPTPGRRDAALPGQPSPSPTAEESARNWLAFRESQKQAPTAEESAKNWLAFRESQKPADPSHTASQVRSREHEVGADDDPEDDKKRVNRGRDYDAGL